MNNSPKKKRASVKPSMKTRQAGADQLLKIVARLEDQVGKADSKPSWRERSIAALAGNSDINIGLIKGIQIQRDAGVQDQEISFYAVAYAANGIADERGQNDAELTRLNQAIDAANKAHGLADDEYWAAGEAPDDVQALEDAFEQRFNSILADVLREYGEDEMADLLLSDPSAFLDRVEIGREKMFGPLPKDQDELNERMNKMDDTGSC